MGRAVRLLLLCCVLTACSAPAPKDYWPSANPLQWWPAPDAPSPRTEVAAAAGRGRIAVVGGYLGDGSTTARTELFDPATGKWEAGPDLPAAVNHAMATTVDDTVYVFGGYLAGDIPATGAYRLDAGGWHSLAPLPEARAAGTAAAVDGTVYIAGGIGPGQGQLAGAMLRYDVFADRWSTVEGPPTPREHLGGAGFDSVVYTVGGRTTAAGNLAAFEAYDPRTGQWQRLPDLPTRRGGLSATATCRGQVVAIGGEATETFAEVEAYDVVSGSWRRLPDLPTPRHGLGVVAIGAHVFTFAGGPHPGLHVSRATEMLDTTSLGKPLIHCGP